jgi:hypothetical protein
MNRRLLFVTYTFPPARTAGSVRTWIIAKYLARSGWEVTVLTPDPSLWRHIESPEAIANSLEREGIRRLPTDHRWRSLVADNVKCANHGLPWFIGGIGRRVVPNLGIDRTVGWVKAAEEACTHLTANDVDVILASAPSFSAFTLAQRLAKKLQRPYVLDYRDLWSRNLHHPVPLAMRREASVLAGCAAVTTVSPSWGLVLDRQFGIGSKLHVVSNGYDPDQLAKVKPNDFGHFAIVYTGSLWPPKRVISPLMAALRCLNESVHRSRDGWKFHYYGKHTGHVCEEADRFGVTARVMVHGVVPRSRALEAVKGAGVAVVITSVAESATPEENGMVTGKIFEAIGLGTPTLLIAPVGSDANAVTKITGLARTFAANDRDGIASLLSDLMEGKSLEPSDPTAYSWGNLVDGFDRVLRKVVGA